ncbi:hypothetical protein AVEN_9914-1 [Araneus ventricosus]|uniref:Uncharacterized protein n=1 Tax=Araneus ventricosus TaxID=182803 RepID=A0A4Y2L255_ARAVE|nr:hypothetical protein AVEN_9914-1 [Araneus ventricosus]
MVWAFGCGGVSSSARALSILCPFKTDEETLVVIGIGDQGGVRSDDEDDNHPFRNATPYMRDLFIYLQPAPAQSTQEGVRPSTDRRET